MNSNLQVPKTADEYITFFRTVAGVVNAAADQLEGVDDHERQLAINRLAEGVEFLASLRGDSGIFYSTRPEGLALHQKEMYETEDNLRNRLIDLGYTPTRPHSFYLVWRRTFPRHTKTANSPSGS